MGREIIVTMYVDSNTVEMVKAIDVLLTFYVSINDMSSCYGHLALGILSAI